MKITDDWLRAHNACIEGLEWAQKQPNRDKDAIIEALYKEGRMRWVHWVVIRCEEYDGEYNWMRGVSDPDTLETTRGSYHEQKHG